MTNRPICDVFEEMRKCHEHRNYSYLPSLIEEAQMMANRMESALYDKAECEDWSKRRREEKDAYKKLLEETNELRKEKGEPLKEISRYL